jgi:tetratricopeptide (TPR) repeat protein
MALSGADGKWVTRGVLLIAVLLAAVYLRALDNPLTESDRAILVDGEQLRGPGPALEIFVSEGPISGAGGDLYAPLAGLSLATDRMLWGPSPRGWRITSLVIHGASCVLLLLILLRLNLSGAFALLGALLFGLHPIHTQTINLIISRGHVLSGAFTLAAVLFFLTALGAERPGWRKNAVPPHAWWSLGFFLAGLLSGSEALAFPLFCLIGPWLLGRRYPHPIFYLGLFVVTAVYAVMASVAGAPPEPARLLNGGAAALKGLRLIVAPYGQMVYHPLRVIWSWADVRFLTGLGLAAAFALASVLLRGRRPALVLWPAFVFCALLAAYPSLVIKGALEEPGLYLPAAALCGLVVSVFDSLGGLRRMRQGLAVVLAALVVAAGFGSSARCAVWKDAELVWLEILDRYPNHTLAREKLAEHYREMGLSEKAADLVSPTGDDAFSTAVKLNNEGVTLMDKGRLQPAVKKFREALEALPGFRDAHFNLGVVYHSLGRTDSAVVSFERALEADPGYAKARYNLGIVYERSGDLDRAEAEYRKAAELDPSHAQAWANLGALEGRRGRFREAIPLLERALGIDPALLQVRLNLASAYEKVDVERAKEQWRIYLDQARARGAPPEVLERIERRIESL